MGLLKGVPVEAEQLPLATSIFVTYMDVAKHSHSIAHPVLLLLLYYLLLLLYYFYLLLYIYIYDAAMNLSTLICICLLRRNFLQ
jgi:hypothetical protein